MEKKKKKEKSEPVYFDTSIPVCVAILLFILFSIPRSSWKWTEMSWVELSLIQKCAFWNKQVELMCDVCHMTRL